MRIENVETNLKDLSGVWVDKETGSRYIVAGFEEDGVVMQKTKDKKIINLVLLPLEVLYKTVVPATNQGENVNVKN
jgi:hypothetical protein